jgi:hypothetical protein
MERTIKTSTRRNMPNPRLLQRQLLLPRKNPAVVVESESV